MNRKLLLLSLMLIGLTLFTAAAQETPGNINLALADLSVRVGHPVTLNDLQNWTFEQQVFPDASLGCPQPGEVYAQVQTVAVQYVLTYQGVTYDYRVSDGGVVILCNESETVPPCPPPDVTGYLPPRLTVGGQGRVGAGGIPNNVRELPGSSSRLIGEIPSEAVFTVLDGPNCTTLDKVVWWQVDYNGLIGWTAESKDGEYFLEPIVLPGTIVPTAPPTATPTPTPAPVSSVIDSSNATRVQVVSQPENGSGVYALSHDGELLAVAQEGGIVVVYEVDTNTGSGQLVAQDVAITALAFVTDTARLQVLLVAGNADGVVSVWIVTADNRMTPMAEFSGTGGAITALAFSAPGGVIAAGDEQGQIYLFDLATSTLLTTLLAHQSPITQLSFSANGSSLLSVDEAGAARVWSIPVAAG